LGTEVHLSVAASVEASQDNLLLPVIPLQIDATSLFLLTVAQVTVSGVKVL